MNRYKLHGIELILHDIIHTTFMVSRPLLNINLTGIVYDFLYICDYMQKKKDVLKLLLLRFVFSVLQFSKSSFQLLYNAAIKMKRRLKSNFADVFCDWNQLRINFYYCTEVAFVLRFDGI